MQPRGRRAEVWEVRTGRRLREFAGENSVVVSDGHRLLLAQDRVLTVWDQDPGRDPLRFPAPPQRVYSGAFSPDARRVAIATGMFQSWRRPGEILVRDLDTGKEVAAYRGSNSSVTCVAFSPEGSRLASGGPDGVVRIWNATQGPEYRSLTANRTGVTGIAFSRDGQRLAMTGSDSMVRVVRIQDTGGEREPSPDLIGKAVFTAAAFSPDGRHLLTGSGKPDQPGELALWGASTGKPIWSRASHGVPILHVAFSPDGTLAASAGGRVLRGLSAVGEVKIWDATTGREVRTLPWTGGTVTGIAFSSDGQRLAVAGLQDAGRPGAVRIWEVADGRDVFVSENTTGGLVYSVAFSPDGSVAAGYDGLIRIWKPTAGKEFLTLKGHGTITGLAFSPDGRRLASSSTDSTVRLWEPQTGREVLCLHGFQHEVTAVAFSPDGQQIAGCSRFDPTVRLWHAPLDGK